MPKFKIGDKVRVILKPDIFLSTFAQVFLINKGILEINSVNEHIVGEYFYTVKEDELMRYNIPEKLLELVESKEELIEKADGEIIIEDNTLNCSIVDALIKSNYRVNVKKYDNNSYVIKFVRKDDMHE